MAKQPKESTSRPEAAHPYYSWAKCIEIANAVYRSGGDREDVSRAMLAHELQVDEDSTSLSQQISSAKTFGMVEGRGTYRLTEAGQQYFLPTTENEPRLAELSFLATCKAFKDLIDRFDGNTIPPAPTLANILLKSRAVPPSWKDRVAGIFLDALAQLRIIDASGRLRYAVALQGALRGNQEIPVTTRHDDGAEDVGKSANSKLAGADHQSAPKVKPYLPPNTNEWTFSEAGGTVRVETPNPLPKALWERLKRYVEVLEPASPENGGGHGSTEKRGGE